MPKRHFYFYKFMLVDGVRRKYLCSCAECEVLKNFRFKSPYENIFVYDEIISRRVIQNINGRIFDFCMLDPSIFSTRSSDFLLGYTDYILNLSQIFMIIQKHVSFRLSYL